MAGEWGLRRWLERVEGGLFLLFFFWLPLGARRAVYTTGGDLFPYNTLFLYVTDLIVLGTLILAFTRWIGRDRQMPAARTSVVSLPVLLGLLAFLAITLIAAVRHPAGGLGILYWGRLALFSLFTLYLAKNLDRLGRSWIAAVFLAGVLQSALAIWQFLAQRDMGLSWLGENKLAPTFDGVAKIAVAGEKLLRSYGTFPHPNVLGAFLLLALLVSAYGYLRRPGAGSVPGSRRWLPETAWLGGFALMELALFFSFSRAAWAGGLLGILVLLIGLFKHRARLRPEEWRRLAALLLVTAFVALFTVATFGAAWRARSWPEPREQAVSLRLFLMRASLHEINDHRVLGVGPGNFVPMLQRYLDPSLPRWIWQPVHNLYLLIAAESGLLGLMAFLFLIGFLLRHLRSRPRDALLRAAAASLFVAFLLLAFFDHFFWTFEQGIALFWLSAGLLLAS